jgi:hypothetical protein
MRTSTKAESVLQLCEKITAHDAVETGQKILHKGSELAHSVGGMVKDSIVRGGTHVADRLADAASYVARGAERHGLTHAVQAMRVHKGTSPANAGEIEGYGRMVHGAAREFIRAHTGV